MGGCWSKLVLSWHNGNSYGFKDTQHHQIVNGFATREHIELGGVLVIEYQKYHFQIEYKFGPF